MPERCYAITPWVLPRYKNYEIKTKAPREEEEATVSRASTALGSNKKKYTVDTERLEK